MNTPRNVIRKASPALRKAAPILAAVALMGVLQVAGAAGINLDNSLKPASTAICDTLKGIQTSVFLTIIALVMFATGLFMMWVKVRGGMGLAITGFVGLFIMKQLVSIANTLGIVPTSTCAP